MWTIWMGGGALGFCLFHKDEDGEIGSFVNGIYFAISAASTGGLQGPDTADGPLMFTAIFSFLAVPLYGYTLGMLADHFTASYVAAKEEQRRQKAITLSEFKAVESLSTASEDGAIDVEEFRVLWLLRNGCITPDTLQDITDDFVALDPDGSGSIRISEVQASIAFHTYGKDGDISAIELVKTAKLMQTTSVLDMPDKMLLNPDKVYTLDVAIKGIMNCAKMEARRASMLKLPFSLTQLGFKEHKGKKSGQMQAGLNLKSFMKWWWEEACAYLEEKPVGEDERHDARQKLANHLEQMSYAMGSKKASSNTQGRQMLKLPDITGASNRFESPASSKNSKRILPPLAAPATPPGSPRARQLRLDLPGQSGPR